MKFKAMLVAALVILAAVVAGAGVRDARAVLPPGNTAQQWDKLVMPQAPWHAGLSQRASDGW